jgi:GNAT superfamily N-acetyltransferase
MPHVITTIEYADILPLWQNLWPSTENIQPYNKFRFMTTQEDARIPRGPVYYIGAYDSNNIVGCISCYSTSELGFRVRGIYVDPNYQRKGIGRLLLSAVDSRAQESGHTFVWGYPRQSSWGLYEKCGYMRLSNWFNDFTYGPNAWAMKTLNEISPTTNPKIR